MGAVSVEGEGRRHQGEVRFEIGNFFYAILFSQNLKAQWQQAHSEGSHSSACEEVRLGMAVS